jgi:hypothetical protein
MLAINACSAAWANGSTECQFEPAKSAWTDGESCQPATVDKGPRVFLWELPKKIGRMQKFSWLKACDMLDFQNRGSEEDLLHQRSRRS